MAYKERPQGCPAHVDALETYGECWPEDRPFPFSAEEALCILKGYAVSPAAIPGGLTFETFMEIPGTFELVDGRLVTRR